MGKFKGECGYELVLAEENSDWPVLGHMPFLEPISIVREIGLLRLANRKSRSSPGVGGVNGAPDWQLLQSCRVKKGWLPKEWTLLRQTAHIHYRGLHRRSPQISSTPTSYPESLSSPTSWKDGHPDAVWNLPAMTTHYALGMPILFLNNSSYKHFP